MMTTRRTLALCSALAGVLGLWLGACQRAEAPPTAPQDSAPSAAAPASTASPAAQFGPHQSPVTVKLVGPEQVSAGQDIEVTAEVEQRVGTPVNLELQLPDGARLVSGSTSEVLPAGNGTLVRHFVVHLDRVPLTDIQAVATTQSSSFGARAKSAYRFGRPEPRFTDPPRAPKPLSVGGKDVGRPIRLRPSP